MIPIEQSSITEQPIEFALPEGWIETSVGSVSEPLTSGFACGTKNVQNGLRHLRMNNISDECALDLSLVRTVPLDLRLERYALQYGDMLCCTTNSGRLVGKVCLFDQSGEWSFSNHLTRIRPKCVIEPKWLYYNLRLLWQSGAYQEFTRNWVNQSTLPKEALASCAIPLPPLAEQKRIVAAVERLLAEVDAARERLDRLPALLKRFRQSVLAAAFDGRLTEDWRQQSKPAQSGDELLASIRACHHGSLSSRVKHDDTALDLDEMPELPFTWSYSRADGVVEPGTVITYGIVLPGPNLPNGVPYVRGLDVEDGVINVRQLWRTTPEIAAKHARSSLRAGDVLLCIIRHLKVAVVPIGIDGANLTQGTVRLRPSRIIAGRFLAYSLTGPHAQAWMKRRYFGMSMPRINVEDAREIPIPIPPLAEQAEIVRRVGALFNVADEVEAAANAARERTDRLTQAVLAKAFRGELVATEAELARREGRSYETAAELLAKVAKSSILPKSRKPWRKSDGDE